MTKRRDSLMRVAREVTDMLLPCRMFPIVIDTTLMPSHKMSVRCRKDIYKLKKHPKKYAGHMYPERFVMTHMVDSKAWRRMGNL